MEYLLKGVQHAEYNALKAAETDIVSAVMNGFNDTWIPKVAGVKVTFRYNLERNSIGIFVGANGHQRLVLDNEGLDESEAVVVASLYQNLEQRLDRIKLPKESWVDFV